MSAHAVTQPGRRGRDARERLQRLLVADAHQVHELVRAARREDLVVEPVAVEAAVCGYPSARARGDTHELALVQHLESLAGHVPHARRAVEARGHEPLAVAREAGGEDRALLPRRL
jgi:hypothetical protein